MKAWLIPPVLVPIGIFLAVAVIAVFRAVS